MTDEITPNPLNRTTSIYKPKPGDIKIVKVSTSSSPASPEMSEKPQMRDISVDVPRSDKAGSSDSGSANEKSNVNPLFFDPRFEPKAIQKIVKEGILIAGGGAAILLQVAEGGVGAGVNEHSNFAYRPIDRLRTTMTYVYCMAYGTVQEKETIINLVHKAHAPVHGAGYDANDVDLQLWVAATLYATGTDIYEKMFGAIPEDQAEEIYRQYSVIATSLRVPPEMWPVDRRAFWAYWDHKIATMEVTAHAKNVAKDLMWNKSNLFIRSSLPILRVLTAEWLPPRLREEYGLKTSKPRRAVYKVTMGVMKGVYPLVPQFVRTYPVRYYLKDMRKRMNKMNHLI